MGLRKKSLLITAFCLAGALAGAGVSAGIWGRVIFNIHSQFGLGKSARYPDRNEKGIFEISSLEDFVNFQYFVENGYKGLDGELLADLDFDGKKYCIKDYNGHFNGNGYSIRNSAMELFIRLESEAKVENLNFEDVRIIDRKHGTGAAAYFNYGEISNCQVSGHVEGLAYTGGIVCTNLGVIADCTNYADVISTQTGETYEYNNWISGYGAGGIAGLSGTSRREENIPSQNLIVNCANYGNVTAKSLAGGICAYLEDSSASAAADYSVQEMAEKFGFSYENRESGADCGLDESAMALTNQSIVNCRNYGDVMIEQMTDKHQAHVNAAGICGYLHRGNLYHCANLGNILVSENAPKVSAAGWAYTCRTMAVSYNMGFAQNSRQHILDCVSLQGTVSDTMRHESVMELTEEEMALWEEGRLFAEDRSYISNNWRFNLDEAVRLCALEPLGVEENAASLGRDNYYLCDEFAIYLPDGFVITEQKSGGVLYGLRMFVPASYGGEAGEQYEAWLIRRQVDMDTALESVRQSNTKWRIPYFMEECFSTLINEHILSISSLNLPFHACFKERRLDGKRICMEKAIPMGWEDVYMGEGDHILGNVLSIPLEGNIWDGLEAKWIMVFGNEANNIRPSYNFIDTVENGFYALNGQESLVRAEAGDCLWELAGKYTGDEENWGVLAGMNGMENPDMLLEGQMLLVPDFDIWQRRPEGLNASWLCGQENSSEAVSTERYTTARRNLQ